MNDLVEKIDGLSREQALEAANFVADVIATEADTQAAEADIQQLLAGQPYQHIKEVEQLARLTLVAAALSPQYEDIVRKSIEASGQKQFILGGLEIVAIGVLALGAIQVLMSHGKTSEHKKIEIGEKDGNSYVKIDETVTYGLPASLAKILGNIPGSGQK
jgi:hypothetical protein